MESLRFLLVSTFYPPYHLGGDAVHVQYLAQALAAAGHEVHVEFAPAAYRLKAGRTPRAAAEAGEEVRTHPIPAPWGRLQPLSAYAFGHSRRVTRFHRDLVRELAPDVVHYHNISLLGLGVLPKDGSARTLYTAHDYWVRCPRSDLFKYGRRPCETATCARCNLATGRPPPLWRRSDATDGFRHVQEIIAPSAFMAQMLRDSLPGPIHHIPNFAPDPNPKGETGNPEAYYLYVGALGKHKGVLPLTAMAPRLPEGISLLVVGAGELATRLGRRANKPAARFTLRNWVPPEELQELYRHARGLILPSLWYENAPLVALEALSWGTPLLVSRRGGLPELLAEGSAGLSFEPGEGGIETAIQEFEARNLPETLRPGARRAYERRHTPGRFLQAYTRLIAPPVGEGPSASAVSLPADSPPSATLPP